MEPELRTTKKQEKNLKKSVLDINNGQGGFGTFRGILTKALWWVRMLTIYFLYK